MQQFSYFFKLNFAGEFKSTKHVQVILYIPQQALKRAGMLILYSKLSYFWLFVFPKVIITHSHCAEYKYAQLK